MNFGPVLKKHWKQLTSPKSRAIGQDAKHRFAAGAQSQTAPFTRNVTDLYRPEPNNVPLGLSWSEVLDLARKGESVKVKRLCALDHVLTLVDLMVGAGVGDELSLWVYKRTLAAPDFRKLFLLHGGSDAIDNLMKAKPGTTLGKFYGHDLYLIQRPTPQGILTPLHPLIRFEVV